MWQKIFLLGMGGFIGSNLRYWISLWTASFFGNRMPLGTLFVNGIGSFVLGFITAYGTRSSALSPALHMFVGTGMMGALTTFSTFSLETFRFLEESSYGLALLNTLFNMGIGLLAVWAGFMMAQALSQ